MSHAYVDPVSKLLTFRKLDHRRSEPWPDYLAIGLTEQHVPDLVRMATDADLNHAHADSLEVWAPLHAWRALGQLRAAEAAPVLIRLFEDLADDDWLPSELTTVFSMMGPVTVPALAAFLDDDTVDEYCRVAVPECLEQIARDHPGARDECVAALIRRLKKHEGSGPALNAFLILSLTKLHAVEGIDAIRTAFARDEVDLQIQGDLEDVEISMGLRTHRETPPPRLGLLWQLHKSNVDKEDPSEELWDFPNVPVRRGEKTGRNDPCPCGSGRKFKKCCLH